MRSPLCKHLGWLHNLYPRTQLQSGTWLLVACTWEAHLNPHCSGWFYQYLFGHLMCKGENWKNVNSLWIILKINISPVDKLVPIFAEFVAPNFDLCIKNVTLIINSQKIIETFLSIFDLIKLSLITKNDDNITHDHILISEEINLNERI